MKAVQDPGAHPGPAVPTRHLQDELVDRARSALFLAERLAALADTVDAVLDGWQASVVTMLGDLDEPLALLREVSRQFSREHRAVLEMQAAIELARWEATSSLTRSGD